MLNPTAKISSFQNYRSLHFFGMENIPNSNKWPLKILLNPLKLLISTLSFRKKMTIFGHWPHNLFYQIHLDPTISKETNIYLLGSDFWKKYYTYSAR